MQQRRFRAEKGGTWTPAKIGPPTVSRAASRQGQRDGARPARAVIISDGPPGEPGASLIA